MPDTDVATATAAHAKAIVKAGLDPTADRTHAWWDAYEAACSSSAQLRRAEADWIAATVADTLERNARRRH